MIDEMGYLPMGSEQANLFFQVVTSPTRASLIASRIRQSLIHGASPAPIPSLTNLTLHGGLRLELVLLRWVRAASRVASL